MNTQLSEDSTMSMEANSTPSSSQSSTPNSRQSEESNKKPDSLFCFHRSTRNEMRSKNQNEPENGELTQPRRVSLSPGTIAEALKQLQRLEEKEEREMNSSNFKIVESTKIRLERQTTHVDFDNCSNIRKTSPVKNIKKLSLNVNKKIEGEDQDSVTNDCQQNFTRKNFTELTPELLEIYQEKEILVGEILHQIYQLRELQLIAMSYCTRQRALAAKCPTYVTKDYPSLYGRCFNLSMNLKILKQCQYGDSSIASRVLSDFEILEKSLEAKLPLSSEEITSLLDKIQI